MTHARVLTVACTNDEFAAHHGLARPRPGDVLQLGDTVGQGGFGEVVRITTIASAPPPRPTLLKCYEPGAVGDGAVIVDSVTTLGEALAMRGPAGWQDRLLALPYWVGRVATPTGERLAALMIDLGAQGYVTCSFDPTEASRHRRWPLRGRLELAASFARAFADLEAIGYLHSDINPENVLLSFAHGDAQVIDLDAGVVIGPGCPGPHTVGKADEFLPPEVRDPSAPGSIALDRFTPAAERWSLASLLGYLIFAVHPGFFLRSLSGRTLDAYAASGRDWPDIDPASDLFTDREASRRAYAVARDEFAALPPAMLEAFRRLFRAGTDGTARPTAVEWLRALTDMRRTPVFVELTVSAVRVIEGDLVEVSWSTRDATSVSALDNDRLPPNGTVFLQANRSCSIAVTAKSPTAAATAHTPWIDVVARPTRDEVPIGNPDVPDALLATTPGLEAVATAHPSVPVVAGPPAPSPAPRRLASATGGPSTARLPPLQFSRLGSAPPWPGRRRLWTSLGPVPRPTLPKVACPSVPGMEAR